MTKEDRTDKFLELVKLHNPAPYKFTRRVYSRYGGKPGRLGYFRTDNTVSVYAEGVPATEIRAFIAYAWYLGITLHNMTHVRLFMHYKSVNNSYVQDFLQQLRIPYSTMHNQSLNLYDLLDPAKIIHESDKED